MNFPIEELPNNLVFLQALNVAKRYIDKPPKKIAIGVKVAQFQINEESKDTFVEYNVIIHSDDEGTEQDEENKLIEIEILYKISFTKNFKDMNLNKEKLAQISDFIVYPYLLSLVEKLCYDMGFPGVKIPLNFLGKDSNDQN